MTNLLRLAMVLFVAMTPHLALAVEHGSLTEEQPALRPFDQQPPPPTVPVASILTEIPWRLEELIGESLSDEQATPYLLFTKHGDLIGFGGCNYFIGKYRLDDHGAILVSSLRASHLECQETSKTETTLLTSLVMANNLVINDNNLTFFMDINNLMRLRLAPSLGVEELVKQGMQLRTRKVRIHKASSKKKKIVGKSKGRIKQTGATIMKKRGKPKPAPSKRSKTH